MLAQEHAGKVLFYRQYIIYFVCSTKILKLARKGKEYPVTNDEHFGIQYIHVKYQNVYLYRL